MSNATQHIIEEALRLPAPERAAIAAELLASIDTEGVSGADAEWLAEIEQRTERAERGETVGLDWPTVRQRLEEKYRLR